MERWTQGTPSLFTALRNLDRRVSQAVRRFDLIGAGDRLLVACSGGKDSWCLLEVLAARRSWAKEKYELVACHVHRPGCGAQAIEDALRRRCAELDVPLVVVAQAAAEAEEGCFRCAWERRRLLFETAVAQGCTRVAFGHHLDDLAETVLLNLFFRGEISTMYPRQEMFDGRIVIIRPLALVEEKALVRVAAFNRPALPGCGCTEAATSQRAKMKQLVRELRATCPGIRANLVRPVLAGWDAAAGGHQPRNPRTPA